MPALRVIKRTTERGIERERESGRMWQNVVPILRCNASRAAYPRRRLRCVYVTQHCFASSPSALAFALAMVLVLDLDLDLALGLRLSAALLLSCLHTTRRAAP